MFKSLWSIHFAIDLPQMISEASERFDGIGAHIAFSVGGTDFYSCIK